MALACNTSDKIYAVNNPFCCNTSIRWFQSIQLPLYLITPMSTTPAMFPMHPVPPMSPVPPMALLHWWNWYDPAMYQTIFC